MVVIRKIQWAYNEFTSWPKQAQLPIYALLGYLVFVILKYA